MIMRPHSTVEQAALAAEQISSAAAFRPLLRQVLTAVAAGDDGHAARIGVTACRRGEGVSTIATQLAWAAADLLPEDSLLVDCNPKSKIAGAGLLDLAYHGGELEQLVQPTSISRLWTIPCGSSPLRPRLFDQPALIGEALDRLAQPFGPLICDLPCVDQASGMLDLAALLDGVLLVVEAGRTPQEDVAAAQKVLARRRIRLLGVVLNKQRK
jgi:Mrp family chromosome partitioning ATPase